MGFADLKYSSSLDCINMTFHTFCCCHGSRMDDFDKKKKSPPIEQRIERKKCKKEQEKYIISISPRNVCFSLDKNKKISLVSKQQINKYINK